jgi:hypothetical protein
VKRIPPFSVKLIITPIEDDPGKPPAPVLKGCVGSFSVPGIGAAHGAEGGMRFAFPPYELRALKKGDLRTPRGKEFMDNAIALTPFPQTIKLSGPPAKRADT